MLKFSNDKTFSKSYPFADRTPVVTFIWSQLLSQLTRSLQSTVINGFENLFVQQLRLFTIEWVAHQNKSICQALNSNSNRAMAKVRQFGLDNNNYLIWDKLAIKKIN